MPFPTTITQAIEAGYKFNSDANCRGCGARIQWWITPLKANMPVDVSEFLFTSHWATCPKAKDFRRK